MLGGYFDYRAHFVSLPKLFLSREWGYGSSGFPDELLNLSVGIVQWLFGLATLFLAYFNRKKNQKLFILTLLLSVLSLFTLFMIHMKSSFIWKLLPVLWWMQFPWRFLSVSIFLLSLVSGIGVYLIGKKHYIFGVFVGLIAILLNVSYFVPKSWLDITDNEKFSGVSWQKQMTISIFDYLPKSAVLPPINEAPKTPEIMDGKAEIISYKKASNFQYGQIKVIEDVNIRLPLFDFPGMKVKVNGNIVSHFDNDCRGHNFCYGLISIKLSKGEYNIEARLTDTPIRKVGNLITLVSLVVVLVLVFYRKRK
jgi:hypothetical protein